MTMRTFHTVAHARRMLRLRTRTWNARSPGTRIGRRGNALGDALVVTWTLTSGDVWPRTGVCAVSVRTHAERLARVAETGDGA